MSQSGKPFKERFAVKQISQNTFESVHPPERLGNALNIAYGGFTLAFAAKCACLSVPLNYYLYTLTGSYLGPALTDRTLHCSVREVRQTRTFATRQVEVSQLQDDGKSRLCFYGLADFQVPEQASLLTYSMPPSRQYTRYDKLVDGPTRFQSLADQGKIPQRLADMQKKAFGLLGEIYEMRPCPEGIFAQNLSGLGKQLPTSQDDLPITEKSTADWLRSLHPLSTPAENLANLAFIMDGAMSFAPLSFSHMFLEDAAAASSLDVALRVFSNNVDMGKWHLRELRTRVGSEGRTFSEADMWDEEGVCVASISQQCILRPHKRKEGMGKL